MAISLLLLTGLKNAFIWTKLERELVKRKSIMQYCDATAREVPIFSMMVATSFTKRIDSGRTAVL